jgi:hypothetical protein
MQVGVWPTTIAIVTSRHVSDKGVPYEFTSPQQLLENFFNEVDRVPEETKS